MSATPFRKLASASFFLVACLALDSCEALKFIRGKAALRKAQIAQARLDANSLVVSVQAYHLDRASFPAAGDAGEDMRITTGTKLMSILTGSSKKHNPRKIKYFQSREAVGGKGGLSWELDDGRRSVRLLDPWGNEYFALFDSDLDGGITDPFDPEKKLLRGHKVIAWSAGPDRKTNPDPRHEDNADNIFSWR